MLIIVEGKNDKSRLRRLLVDVIDIICTYGTPGTTRLDRIKHAAAGHEVIIFTDNDPSGKRIRGMLSDVFPDADHIYTRKGYAGVEGTPDEYLVQQLEKAGLEEWIDYASIPEYNAADTQQR